MTAYPTIRSVKLNKIKSQFDRVMDAPWLDGLRVLNLTSNSLGVRRIEKLANNSRLGNLKSLNLQSNNIGAKGARAILNSAMLTNLERLSLENSGIPAHPSPVELFQGDRAQSLTWLRLFESEWSSLVVLEELLASDLLPRLQYLAHPYDQLAMRTPPTTPVEGLLDSVGYQRLTHLELFPLSEVAAEAFCNHPHSANIRSLMLTHLPLHESSYITSDSPIWNGLEFLSTSINDDFLARLSANSWLHDLKCLHQPGQSVAATAAALQLDIPLIPEWNYNGWQFAENLDFIYGCGNAYI